MPGTVGLCLPASGRGPFSDVGPGRRAAAGGRRVPGDAGANFRVGAGQVARSPGVPAARGPVRARGHSRNQRQLAAGHRRTGDLRSRREREPGPGRTRRRGQRIVAASRLPHPPDQAPERRPVRKRPQLDRRDQRPRVGADRIAQAGHGGQRPDHPRPHRQVPRPHPGGVRGARLAGWAAVAVGRQTRADGNEPGSPACPTFRSTGCRRRPGTDSCSTPFCASGRRGATSRRTITCRRCWSIGRPCPAARRTGAASRGWRRWNGCWCCSRS